MKKKDLDFSSFVLKWFDAHGRKSLPWQSNKTPFRVWVSEIMLQQTQVKTVIPFYERFMKRFPDVESLANAETDEVLHVWTGLGYYTRARNLHKAAKIILKNFAGNFPNDIDELQKLPGIGRSTAGAILSIAFGKHATILDGNVRRVLARFYGIREWPGEKQITERLWKIAAELTPVKRTGDYSQAMMDLGATICVRSKPLCNACPLAFNCVAYAKDLQTVIPAKKPKKELPIRETNFLILQTGNFVFLEKRAPVGIWGGLWSLPQVLESDLKKFLKKMGLKFTKIFHGNVFRHTFSHFHLDISPIFVSVERLPHKISESENYIWYDLQLPQRLGLPAPVKKILLNLSDNKLELET